MPCNNVDGTVEIPLSEYNRLQEYQKQALKRELASKEERIALSNDLLEFISGRFDPSIGVTSNAADTLKAVVAMLRELARA